MKYIVTVNGKKYEVEVERAEASGNGAPLPQAAETTKTANPAPAPSGVHTVSAPMPGQISDIKVSAGQTVQKGQVLLILEAMKMENEILADRGGVVTGISVSKGASVNTGDSLLTIQ